MRLHLCCLLLLGGCGDSGATAVPRAPVENDTRPDARHAVASDPVQDALYGPASFERLPPSSPTGWRARFPAPGQSFIDYLGTHPRRPVDGADRLYLLPLGELETAMVVDHDYAYIVHTPPARDMVAVLHAFFAMPVQVLPTRPVETLLTPDRIESGHEQFRAQRLLAATAAFVPDDAFSMTSLVVRDVYFDDAQSFGYGFGQHRDGQAVVSFARLDPVVSGHRSSDNILEILPLRGFKLLVHEVGHTFGFEHCTEYRCVMNGFADLEELDATPLHLGPVCLRKLLFATEADPADRYRQLTDSLEQAGLKAQAKWTAQRWEDLQQATP